MNLEKAITRNQNEENTAAPEYVHSMILRPGRRNHSHRRFPWVTVLAWIGVIIIFAAAVIL